MAVNPRWGALRSLVTAVRVATSPGSASLGTRLGAVPRLVRAVFRGNYTGTAKSTLGLVVLGVVYVLSPIDLVPEAFLSVFGLGDDAVVIAWIAAALVNETESFLTWERARPGSARHETVPGETVPGNVAG